MERKIRSLPPAHFGRKPLGRGQLAGFSSAAADRPVWLRHLRFARAWKNPPRRNLRQKTG